MRAIKLLQRNPAKPSLRERLGAMRAKAAGLGSGADKGRRAMLAGSVAAAGAPLTAAGPVASDGRGDYLARLLTAYAEDRACRPISNTAEFNSIEDEASRLVLRRCRDVYVEILALPPPQATDGLALAALAAAIALEVSLDGPDNPQPDALAAVVATRALLAVTGTALPPGFSGFGDEPDCSERDAALFDKPGSLPAWAVAEAEAEDGAASPNPLASVPLDGLFALADLYSTASRHFHVGAFWPKLQAGERRPGSDIATHEGDRLSEQFAETVTEMARREPRDDTEAEQRREWQVRGALDRGDERAAVLALMDSPCLGQTNKAGA